MLHTAIESAQPVISMRDGKAFTNSRDVAKIFGKQHKNVLRVIDGLIDSEPSLGFLKFEHAPVLSEHNGRSHRTFDMTREGFMVLCMSFSGDKFLNGKIRFIDAFSAIDAEMQRMNSPAPAPINNISSLLANPSTLRQLLIGYTEKVEQLESKVQAMEPDVLALQRIAKSEGSTSITEAAKNLQMRPSDLFKFLRGPEKWIYRRPNSTTDLAYADKIKAGLLEHKTTIIEVPNRNDKTIMIEKNVTQILVTSKGLAYLARKFSQPDFFN